MPNPNFASPAMQQAISDPSLLTASSAPWMTSVQMPPLASSQTRQRMQSGPSLPTDSGSAPWATEQVIMPDEDQSSGTPQRTDFTQEIDGAFAQRGAGSKHFSEVARSGNGNPTSDLDVQDDKDYTEVDGLGEHLECLSLVESTRVDGLGAMARIPKFRWPKLGEIPPYAPAPGKAWVRRRVLTNARQPGGLRVAKVKWAQMSGGKVQQAVASGDLPPSVSGLGGLGMSSLETTGISLGLGVAGGLLLWFLLKKRKAA